jgi:hypothetical protein
MSVAETRLDSLESQEMNQLIESLSMNVNAMRGTAFMPNRNETFS